MPYLRNTVACGCAPVLFNQAAKNGKPGNQGSILTSSYRKTAEVELYYGEGISREVGLIDLGDQCGILEKSGAWYSYGENRLGQGRENVRQFLRGHPEIAGEIEGKVREVVLSAKSIPGGEVTVTAFSEHISTQQ
ncbi:MAG: hypothetical protein ACYDEQ_06770 [Desulfocucumaceae bacterium]